MTAADLDDDTARLDFLQLYRCAIAYDEGEYKIRPSRGPGGRWCSDLREATDSIMRLHKAAEE